MTFDGQALGQEVVGLTRSFVERAIAPLQAELTALKEEIAALKAVTPKDGRDGVDGMPGIPGEKGERGADGAAGLDGKEGPAGRDGLTGRDGASIGGGVIDRDGVLQVTLTDGKIIPVGVVVAKADSDLSDKEFERRVEAALAESPAEAVRDAVAGAMREVPRPTINVSVPITMPRRGKEVMTVEHDAKGRIKRSIKEEVD